MSYGGAKLASRDTGSRLVFADLTRRYVTQSLPFLVGSGLACLVFAVLTLKPTLLSDRELAGFWLQASILALACILAVRVGDRFQIPDLVMIIAVAIVLGPNSPVGILTFKSEELAWLAVIFKVLRNGLSVNLRRAISEWQAVAICGLNSFLFPFGAVLGIAYLVDKGFFKPYGLFSSAYYNFDFFLACALAFAAAPLALVDNILDSANLRRTPYGTLVTSYQAFNEIITWTVFAVVVSHFSGEAINPLVVFEKGGLIVFLAILIAYVALRFGPRVSQYLEERSVRTSPILATVTIGTLLVASLLDGLCHGGIVLSLMLGVAIANIPYASDIVRNVGSNFISFVCLPIFFYQAFVNVNVLEAFSFELFCFVVIAGMIPSYLGVLAAGISPGIRWNPAHRMGVAASAMGISSIVVVQFLLPDGSPGKAELLSALALAVPLSAYLGAEFLRRSYRHNRKTNLGLSFKRGGFKMLADPKLNFQEELESLFCQTNWKGRPSYSESFLLQSVIKSAKFFSLPDRVNSALLTLPLPTHTSKLQLFVLMSREGPVQIGGKRVRLVLVVVYPSEDQSMLENLDVTIRLFSQELKRDQGALMRKMLAAKEASNPEEVISKLLEEADARISFSLK